MSAVRFHPKAPPKRAEIAGVAQLAEQLICNQQVVGSIPITSSSLPRFYGVKFNMGGLQSGQMHQTVNLTSPTSVVRIHLLPPQKRAFLSKKCPFLLIFRLFLKSLRQFCPKKSYRITPFYTRIFAGFSFLCTYQKVYSPRVIVLSIKPGQASCAIKRCACV